MNNRRGSIVVMYMIILSTLITGAVASVAVLSNSETQSSSVGYDRDQAFYAAEAGVQRAVWNLNYGTPATFLTSLGQLQNVRLPNGAAYTITANTTNWPTAPVTFQCTGTSADSKAVSQASVTVTDNTTTSPGYSPGFAMSGADTFSGTLNIAGTFESTGSFTGSGRITLANVSGQPNASLESTGSYTGSGTFSVPGNLYFTGNIVTSGSVTVGGSVQSGGSVTHSGTWSVAGTTTQHSNPLASTPFSTPTVDTSGLISGKYGTVQTISGGSPSSLTLDFSQNPVIEITSNLTVSGSNITIIPPASGTGTLIINGNLTLSGTLGTSSSPVNMNVVSTGNITQSGTQYVTGSLCCGGALTCSGTYNVSGCTVVQKGITGSGTMNLSYVSPPSFVDWADTGSGVGSTSTSTIKVSNFMGPIY